MQGETVKFTGMYNLHCCRWCTTNTLLCDTQNFLYS